MRKSIKCERIIILDLQLLSAEDIDIAPISMLHNNNSDDMEGELLEFV